MLNAKKNVLVNFNYDVKLPLFLPIIISIEHFYALLHKKMHGFIKRVHMTLRMML